MVHGRSSTLGLELWDAAPALGGGGVRCSTSLCAGLASEVCSLCAMAGLGLLAWGVHPKPYTYPGLAFCGTMLGRIFQPTLPHACPPAHCL